MLIISTRPVAEIIHAVSAALMVPPSASAGAGLPSVTATIMATALDRTDMALISPCAKTVRLVTTTWITFERGLLATWPAAMTGIPEATCTDFRANAHVIGNKPKD